MKKVWIEIESFSRSFITDAIEHGADAFFTSRDSDVKKITDLAKIEVYSLSDLPEHISFITIDSKEQEKKAARISGSVSLIIDTAGWKIIPLENLIALRENNYALVRSTAEAREALGILEKGCDGVYLSGCSDEEKLAILKELKQQKGTICLSKGTVIKVEKTGLGDRICIDTINSMHDGEGMLVGDYANGMVLVNAEAMENPYVASRPFRVNAGAVHCYILTPGGRTKYLSDLRSGDEALVVNHKGETFTTVIGRIKMEKRPMLRLEIQGKEKLFSIILQNAETIRTVLPGGHSKSVLELKKGDEVVIYEEEGGRHFGYKINETIDEK